MNVHFFKLLQDHYFIITLYYCHVTTHYFLIITVLLLDYCKGTFHYFVIITYLLLLHYVSITTILLPDYYRITTIDCFIIPWSILWLITTWLLQLLPLLPIFITTLIPITTIITIIHLPNLEMNARCCTWKMDRSPMFTAQDGTQGNQTECPRPDQRESFTPTWRVDHFHANVSPFCVFSAWFDVATIFQQLVYPPYDSLCEN